MHLKLRHEWECENAATTRPSPNSENPGFKAKRLRITGADIGATLDVRVGSVMNYTSEKWLTERGLLRFPVVNRELQVPRSAMENKAWGRCQSGNHEWMKDTLYEV